MYAEALRAMTDRAFCQSERYSDQQGRAERNGAQQAILDFERKFISRCRKMGIPLFTHCCIRGSVEQNRLFKEGMSKARAGESPHNYGAAVDIIHGTKGWTISRKQWAILGHIGKETAAVSGISVVWGGDWKFFDPAHWELTNWRDVRSRYEDGEDWDGRQ